MSKIGLVLALCFPVFASADFSISIELDEPSAISSTLALKNQNCIGTNQKIQIKHSTKVCNQIFREYKELFAKVPDTLPPGSDEPTVHIKVNGVGSNWSRTVGRVSGDTPPNRRLRSLTNEILKLNAK